MLQVYLFLSRRVSLWLTCRHAGDNEESRHLVDGELVKLQVENCGIGILVQNGAGGGMQVEDLAILSILIGAATSTHR